MTLASLLDHIRHVHLGCTASEAINLQNHLLAVTAAATLGPDPGLITKSRGVVSLEDAERETGVSLRR